MLQLACCFHSLCCFRLLLGKVGVQQVVGALLVCHPPLCILDQLVLVLQLALQVTAGQVDKAERCVKA